MDSEAIAVTICMVTITLAMLVGIGYDTNKESQCKIEAMKVGFVAEEIGKICK